MSQTEVFFSTADVASVAEQISAATTGYEALFINLGKQIVTTIEPIEDPSDQLAVALQYTKDALIAFQQNFPDNNQIDCKKGCAHCCSFPIETPPQVITDIALFLKQHYSESALDNLKKKLAINISQRQAPLFRAPCPFLDEQNGCTIYEKRPLSCRCFTSPNAELCRLSLDDGRNISQHPVHYRIYQAATAALQTNLKNRGEAYEQIAFIPALLEELNG